MPESPLLANRTEIKFFSILGTVLFVLLILSFIIGHRIQRGTISSPAGVATVTNPFDSITLTAKAAYVYDVRGGKVLYAKSENARLPLASLTKVMTALVATDIAPKNAKIIVSREAVQTDGDSGLRVGESWSLKNLIDFSLTSSSNDGMRAIGFALGALSNSNASESDIESDFVSTMNTKADTIGMKNTYFFNDTGLDLPTEGATGNKGGAYGTAKDMATLFAYILQNNPDLMEATRNPTVSAVSLDNIRHNAQNTDAIVSDIPGVKASKTGFTDLAGGNLVVAFDPELGRPIVISVLGSTQDGRFDDMIKLVNASLKYAEEGQGEVTPAK